MVKNSLFRITVFLSLFFIGASAGESLSHYVKQLNAAKTEAQLEKTYEHIKSLYLNAIVSGDDKLRKAAQKVLDEKETYLANLQPQKNKSPSKKTNKQTILQLQTVQNSDIGVSLNFSQSISEESVSFLHIHDKNKGFRKNIYDIENSVLSKNHSGKLKNGVRYKVAQFDKKTIRIVFYTRDKFYTSSSYKADTLTITTKVPSKPVASTSSSTSQKTTSKTSNASSGALPRVLRSKKIVLIDPGHGGKDCGTRSSGRVCEKKVVLAISRFVAKELNNMGYTTYLTRANDKFVNLRSRTHMANKKNADIFVSIHANAVMNKKSASKLKGVETYFLSRARTSRAKKVAAIENQEDLENLDYFSKNTFLNVLNGQRIVASNKLAIDIQKGILGSLTSKFGDIRDGGVREGPFWVLVGAQMPSVLVETGYLSHPTESKRLNNPYYQKILAKGIARGIDSYFSKNI